MTERGLRKAVFVNTADQGGGAERMSLAALDGFTVRGTDSWLLVGRKVTAHRRVIPMFESPHVDHRPYATLRRRGTRRLRRALDDALGREDFEHPLSRRLLELSGPAPDVIVCDNLHGGYFDLRALAPASQTVPVVLRLFDSWLFTGHCAMPLGCDRWERGCGRCPDLARPPAIRRDATRANWRRKRAVLAGARVFVVAESQWMLERARRSLLAPSVVEWRRIPGGVDVAVFTSESPVVSRRELGIDPRAHVLLSVTHLGTANPHKDFETLRRTAAEVGRRTAVPVILLVIGGDGPAERLGPNAQLRRLGEERDDRRLAALHRVADVYVHAAVEEPFGLGVAAALACATPVVSASTGGVTEYLAASGGGFTVAPGDVAAFADAVVALLSDPGRRRSMGLAAVRFAREQLDVRRTVAELHDWCGDLAARADPTRSARGRIA